MSEDLVRTSEIVVEGRHRLGRRLLDCSRTFAFTIGVDCSLTVSIECRREMLSAVRSTLSMIREFSEEDVMDPLVSLLEAEHQRIAQTEELGTWRSRKQLLQLASELANYAWSLLPFPSEFSAMSGYVRMMADRLRGDKEAWERSRTDMENALGTTNNLLHMAYDVRLHMQFAEAFRVGPCEVCQIDYSRAKDECLYVLKIAQALDSNSTLCVPGIERAAKTNLWMIEISVEDWEAAARSWSEIVKDKTLIREIPSFREFIPHVDSWMRSGTVSVEIQYQLFELTKEVLHREHSPEIQSLAQKILEQQ